MLLLKMQLFDSYPRNWHQSCWYCILLCLCLSWAYLHVWFLKNSSVSVSHFAQAVTWQSDRLRAICTIWDKTVNMADCWEEMLLPSSPLSSCWKIGWPRDQLRAASVALTEFSFVELKFYVALCWRRSLDVLIANICFITNSIMSILAEH